MRPWTVGCEVQSQKVEFLGVKGGVRVADLREGYYDRVLPEDVPSGLA